MSGKASSAKRGLLTVISGTAGGQLLAILAAPIVGRLYPPGVFGPFAVINALVLPLGVVAALRYELAIPLPKSRGTTRDVSKLALAIAAAFTILGTALVALLHGPLAEVLGFPVSQSGFLIWVPVIAGLSAAFAILNQLAIREKKYGAIARRNLLLNAVTVGVQIVLGLAGVGTVGLVLGLALGQLASVVSLAASVRPYLTSPTTGPRLRSVAGRFRSFPLVLAPSGLINSAGLQAPLVLSAALYGASVSGWLGMTQRILALPLALIGQAVAQVFLGEFSEAKRAGSSELQALFLRATRNLLLVGVVGAVVLVVLAPWAFSTFLGAQWHQSGVYAQALALSLAVQMVGNPLSQTIIVMGKNGYQLAWDILRLVLCAGAVVVASRLGFSATNAIWWLSIASAASYLVLWVLSFRAVRAAA